MCAGRGRGAAAAGIAFPSAALPRIPEGRRKACEQRALPLGGEPHVHSRQVDLEDLRVRQVSEGHRRGTQ